MKGNWVRKSSSGTTIVFIHGVLSNSETCWLHENGTYWPELLSIETQISNFGIYVFSYKTGYFSRTYGLEDVVRAFEVHAEQDGVLDSRSIIFVCHSMGGLVARRFVVSRVLSASRTPSEVGFFLIASPSLGSTYANWLSSFARLFAHAQADVLRSSLTNTWLLGLDKDFNAILQSGRIRIEGKELVEDLVPISGKPIVAPVSAARYFKDPYKVENSDHSSISKVANKQSIQHRLLTKFITDFKDGIDTHHKLNHMEKRNSLLVRVSDFTEIPAAEPSEISLAKRLETLFVRHLHKLDVRVVSSKTVPQKVEPTLSISASILRCGDHVIFDFEIAEEGELTFKDSVDIDVQDLTVMLQIFPAAFLSYVGLNPVKFTAERNILPTSNFTAYCMFCEANRLASMQQLERAVEKLDEAIALDANFLSALWSKGDLLVFSGEQEGVTLKHEAEAREPDLKKISLLREKIDPLPEFSRLTGSLKWSKVNEGIEMVNIVSETYGVTICAWKVDWRKCRVSVAESAHPNGDSVSKIVRDKNAILGINAGPWNRDPSGRLTPSGFLASDGRTIADTSAKSGSGIFSISHEGPQICYVHEFKNSAIQEGIQSGPILVEEDGTRGIAKNDHNRVPRTAVGITEDNSILFVLVQGGLSLYELSKILGGDGAEFGFRCKVALNLDGGPSSQASYVKDGKIHNLEGAWLIQSAIVAQLS